MDAEVCTGLRLCWKKNQPSLNGPSRAYGIRTVSSRSMYAVSVKRLFRRTRGPKLSLEMEPHTLTLHWPLLATRCRLGTLNLGEGNGKNTDIILRHYDNHDGSGPWS